MPMTRRALLVWSYVLALCAAIAVPLLRATPEPNDDFGLYQAFAETLAKGRLDLTIPGFHGSDIFAVPVLWLTGSPIAQIHTLTLWAIILPLLGYLAGKAVFRSEQSGVFLATILAFTCFVTTVGLRGWTGPAYWGLMLLSIIFSRRGSWLTGIVWGLAILTKPFAIILLPLLLVLWPEKKGPRSRFLGPGSFIVLGISIVITYLLLQYLQAGRIFVGAHADTAAAAAIQGPARIFLNLVHALQILFSVHNYYYPDPALTGPGNMMHTSPVLVMLGLFALFAPKELFPDRRMAPALLWGAIAGILMNALLDHMDHFYMEASILLFLLAALPALARFPLWIPIALATLHFQLFYFFLQYHSGFALDWTFFLPAVIADGALIAWCAVRWRETIKIAESAVSFRA